MICLAAYTDTQVRALAAGDTPERQAAQDELVRRGLASSPASIAQLEKARKFYKRLAVYAAGDWGFTSRRTFA